MPLLPDDDLAVPGSGVFGPVIPKPLTTMLLLEAFRQGCDLDLACELAGAVADEMRGEPATPRGLLKAVNLLTLRIEAQRPF